MIQKIFSFMAITGIFCVSFSSLRAQESANTADDIVPDQFGFEMIYVPSGTVQMGIDADAFRDMVTTGIFSEFSGANTISIEESYGVFETYETTLQGFWIDRYELTVDQYERIYLRCADSESCSNSNVPQLLSWTEAVGFCASRGSRLPTESEWEYAASGPENFIFPWGDNFDLELLDNPDYLGTELYDVGSRPLNVSWAGVFDMVGNAEEWTDDLFQPYYSWDKTTFTTDWYETWTEYERVVRGGASTDSIWQKTTYSRRSRFYGTAGVRCVRFSHPNGD